MKRNMDLVREILFIAESLEPGERQFADRFQFDNYSSAFVYEHLLILNEAGFITSNLTLTHDGNFHIGSLRLSWDGHDFIETIRNDTVWEETKTIVGKSGGGMIVSIIKSVATKLVTENIMDFIT